MFFTDAEDRHQQQLMAELDVQQPPWDLKISSQGRSFEEQRRIRERWERRRSLRLLQMPGEEKHDA